MPALWSLLASCFTPPAQPGFSLRQPVSDEKGRVVVGINMVEGAQDLVRPSWAQSACLITCSNAASPPGLGSAAGPHQWRGATRAEMNHRLQSLWFSPEHTDFATEYEKGSEGGRDGPPAA